SMSMQYYTIVPKNTTIICLISPFNLNIRQLKFTKIIFLACRWLIHVGYCPCSSNWVVLLRLLSMSIFPSEKQKTKGVKTQDIGNDTKCLIYVCVLTINFLSLHVYIHFLLLYLPSWHHCSYVLNVIHGDLSCATVGQG
uniref:Uncharacterized protein n=1 Tax=Oncorhynchus tshawytscha TaxID=74940 RepID=A0A8C8FZB5_ONCTS